MAILPKVLVLGSAVLDHEGGAHMHGIFYPSLWDASKAWGLIRPPAGGQATLPSSGSCLSNCSFWGRKTATAEMGRKGEEKAAEVRIESQSPRAGTLVGPG